MSQPLFEPTWSVSQLCGEIRGVLGEVFSALWVAGEVQRLKESRGGHLYFELVEKDEGDGVCGKLDAVIWRRDWQRVRRALAATGQEIAEGMSVRCRGGVDFYGAGGRLQLAVREVDPVFTLGLLEKRRRETLAALAEAGLLEANRALALPDLPLTVALVTSEGSAAYHDFVATLAESGYGFRVLLVHAAVQGRTAERELTSALVLAGRAGGPRPADCVVLIRGGGAKSDLAVFDSRAVAEAVARSAVPVLTGLGHEIDESIADRVAHTALKTPTKVAELLIGRVAAAERALAERRAALARAALGRLRDGREDLGRAERGVELARTRLAAAAARLAEHARALARAGRARLREAARRRGEIAARLAAGPGRVLARRERDRLAAGRRIAGAAAGRARTAAARLAGLERLARELAPERTLERGYSITRTRAGELITRPGQVKADDRITTQTAGGTLASRVEEAAG
jgi:exodeoxyribonuclease VII large subunit